VQAEHLFSDPPEVDFYPEEEECLTCGNGLQVWKTRRKKVVTMAIGAFHARETILWCVYDGRKYGSAELRRLCPTGSTFGFDILVHVGKALFLRHRSVEEVRRELQERNIRMSDREVSHLGRKFIVYLALAHRESKERLNAVMSLRGGYILHLDGTCEGDSPMLLTGLDELTAVVLHNVKISSERTELIVPFLSEIRKRHGEPIAIVHDMGRGILAAVQEVFAGVPDFICHFHFLRDIGKDLLERDYTLLRNGLRSHNIRGKLRQKLKTMNKAVDGGPAAGGPPDEDAYAAPISAVDRRRVEACRALISWILDYSADMDGYGFPFDQAHWKLYQRVEKACSIMESAPGVTHLRQEGRSPGRTVCRNLYRLLSETVGDPVLQQASARMTEKVEVFDRLRKALGLAVPAGTEGLNDDGDFPAIKTIEHRVRKFRQWLVSERNSPLTNDYEKMLKQIDKYWEKLFADPIAVETPEGPELIQPQRTNNIMERLFRDWKRGNRRRTGTSSLTKTLRTILADTPLVKNLTNDEYMDILLDGCGSLEERFAQIDGKTACEEMKRIKQNEERISPELKKLIRRPDFASHICSLLATA
jgi:hypothetical protein